MRCVRASVIVMSLVSSTSFACAVSDSVGLFLLPRGPCSSPVVRRPSSRAAVECGRGRRPSTVGSRRRAPCGWRNGSFSGIPRLFPI